MENYMITKSKIAAFGIFLVLIISSMFTQVKGQAPGSRARKEVVDVFLFGRQLAICTRKEESSQYLYVSRIDNHGSPVKEKVLNQGVVNSIVGADADHTELYVYHRSLNNEQKICFYKAENGVWVMTGERKLPAIDNYSNHLRLFMTEDKNKIVFSAQLLKTSGLDDIYVSEWNDAKGWSKLRNLGKKVNTRLPESAMYLRENTLYFSRQIMQEKFVYALPLKRFSKPQMIEEGTQQVASYKHATDTRYDYARSNAFEIVRIK